MLVDPGSNPTRGNRLKSDPYIKEDKIWKYIISIVNWLMARKAEKAKKKKKLLRNFIQLMDGDEMGCQTWMTASSLKFSLVSQCLVCLSPLRDGYSCSESSGNRGAKYRWQINYAQTVFNFPWRFIHPLWSRLCYIFYLILLSYPIYNVD